MKYGELCEGSGCETVCAMLSQWLWIMLYYADPVDGNHGVNAVPVGVNHVVLFWASRSESRSARYANKCESWWTLLSQWLWIMVCYAEPVVVNHCELCWAGGCETLWAMPSQWLWIILCYAEPGVLVSWCAMLSQWLCIIVCYSGMGVWESWCAMLSQWLCIIVCYSELGVRESWYDMLSQSLGITMWTLCQ